MYQVPNNTQNLNFIRLRKGISKEAGMTFIEVLIALFIMATGIFGAIAMQATAKKASFDAMQRSLASSLAQDIVERMRNNDSANLDLYATNSPYGSGKIATSPTCNTTTALCTPTQMVVHDLFGWEQSLMGAGVIDGANNIGGLIGGIGCIGVNGNEVTVVVTWQGRAKHADSKKAAGCGTASEGRRQVVINAFII